MVMMGVSFALVIMDMVVRWRSHSSRGWLLQRKFGGEIFFLPAWILGFVIIAANRMNALGK